MKLTQEQIRTNNFKYRYGITLDDYKIMVNEQNNKCKICGQPPSKRGLFVDHCHMTNNIRGLLCQACNIAIGQMKDDPERLEKAANYVRRSVALKSQAALNISPTSSAA